MEATLDRFGRIVIPKKIREEFHLHAGSSLRIEEGKRGIWLTPVEDEATLVEKEGVLVFSGKTVGNIETAIEEHRHERSNMLREGQ